jgi:processive 1,2-diacylglycerol beta-glucosyltransferase
MVRIPRIGRIKLPRLDGGNLRARLRAQRAWWRRRLRVLARDHEVLFPAEGGGVVAVETLAGDAAAPGPRVAILHATAGSGHRSAALALASAMGALAPGARVREVDTLVFASRFYRSTYAQGYNAMAQRAPQLWGALYHLWAQERVNRTAGPTREALDRLALRSLVRVVEREHPDAVVCTHFLPVEALAPRRGLGRLRVPLYVVITDFTAHPMWAYPHVDRYFVASDEVADELHGHGVPRERIEVTGIPADPRFARTIGRDAARARFRLEQAAPAVLVMGGGSGVGPMGDLARALSQLPSRPQLVVACGTNRRLQADVQALGVQTSGRVRALGFSNEIDVLLEAVDVVVSKAGGLTCAEALIKRTPLVVFRPTPGQEVRNAQYLESGGAAVHADSIDNVATTVERWLADPAARERVRENAGRLARPLAAETIARRVLESLPSRAAQTA